jgi:hypothetical protein
MSITDFGLLLTVVPVEERDRSILRDGYAKLFKLGLPTHYINWKMCERAAGSSGNAVLQLLPLDCRPCSL